jgi:hypothetical protein
MHQCIFLVRIDVCAQPWDHVCDICSIHSVDHQLQDWHGIWLWWKAWSLLASHCLGICNSSYSTHRWSYRCFNYNPCFSSCPCTFSSSWVVSCCCPSRQEAKCSRPGPQDFDLYVPLQQCSHPWVTPAEESETFHAWGAPAQDARVYGFWDPRASHLPTSSSSSYGRPIGVVPQCRRQRRRRRRWYWGRHWVTTQFSFSLFGVWCQRGRRSLLFFHTIFLGL